MYLFLNISPNVINMVVKKIRIGNEAKHIINFYNYIFFNVKSVHRGPICLYSPSIC